MSADRLSGADRPLRELFRQLDSGVPRAYLARLDAQSPLNAGATIAVTLLTAGFLLFQGYSLTVLLWAGAQLGLAALMLARWRVRCGTGAPPLDGPPSRRGLYHALAWALLSGSLWGALTTLLPWAPPHVQIVLILTMGGMAAGASATLAAVPQVAAVYILGCTAPATVYYLAAGGPAGGALALVFSVFTVAMIAMSLVVFSALRRQFSAESYAEQLEQMGAALRESEQRFRATFHNAAVGIAHIGLDGRWLQVNDRVCEILGYSPHELAAGTFQDLTYPDDRAEDQARFEAMLGGDRTGYQIEKRYLHKQGHVVWVQSTMALQRDEHGQRSYGIAVIQDITARKEAEEALRESDRAKDEFLAVLGHELRNPLAPIRTALELLEQAPSAHDLLDSLLPMMDRQLSHLSRLVDDLLDISRISRGVIELQRAPLRLNAPLQAAIEQTRTLIEQRRHQLLVQPADQPLNVSGDFERLTQVFANLLGNAAKYMEPGGTIRIGTETHAGQAVVRIRDTGYGIPPGRIKSLFELFTQIPEHRDGTGGGLGIGLALSRRLVEMHGGSIVAASDGLGHGSEFVVRLPLAAADATAAPVEPGHEADGPPQRVLVVDDNVDAAEGLRMLLEMKGHSVETAYDGPTALEMIGMHQPDVTLLDLGLPRMDGLEVARRARALPGGSAMRLVAVTGWGQDEDRLKTREAGFDAHLTKPIGWPQLALILAADARASLRSGETVPSAGT